MIKTEKWIYPAHIPKVLKDPILKYCAKKDISIAQFFRRAAKELLRKG